MRDFLAKYVPPLSEAQIEEITREYERLLAVQLAAQKKLAEPSIQPKKKGR